MKSQKRMIKMLACLAGSMCGAAVLLAWIEPGSGEIGLDPQRTAEFVHEVVCLSDPATLRRWDGIVVEPQITAATVRNHLAANRDVGPLDHHFRVDADGALVRSPAWERQQDCSAGESRAGVIRIELTSSTQTDRIPMAQWITLRALLAELGRNCSPSAAALPVLIPTPRSSLAEPLADDLRALVGTAQLRIGPPRSPKKP